MKYNCKGHGTCQATVLTSQPTEQFRCILQYKSLIGHSCSSLFIIGQMSCPTLLRTRLFGSGTEVETPVYSCIVSYTFGKSNRLYSSRILPHRLITHIEISKESIIIPSPIPMYIIDITRMSQSITGIAYIQSGIIPFLEFTTHLCQELPIQIARFTFIRHFIG